MYLGYVVVWRICMLYIWREGSNAAHTPATMHVIQVHTDAQFPEELRKAGSSLVIVNFTAAWYT